MEARNSFIVSKGFVNYFIFTVLFAVADQLCTVVDMILVGNFIDAASFSALNLAVPVESIVTGIITIITVGSGIIASRMIGDQEFNSARKVLTVSFITSCAVTVVLSAVSLCFLDRIVSLLCKEASLSIYLKDYLKCYLAGIVSQAIYMSVIMIVNIDGKPNYALKALLVCCAADIILDIVFMKLMGLGVIGVALSSIVSCLLLPLLLLPYLSSRECGFRFVNPGKDWSRLATDNLRDGLPYSLPYFATCLLAYFFNSIILSRCGSHVFYIWCAGYMFFSLAVVLTDCARTILATMGSTLYGSRDSDGLKILVRKCTTFCLAIMTFIFVAVSIFPDSALSAFGYEGTILIPHYKEKIISIVSYSLPFTVCCIKVYTAQTVKNRISSIVPLLVLMVFTFGGFIFTSIYSPDKIFYTMPLAGILYLAVDTLYSRLSILWNKRLSGYFLIPDSDGVPTAYYSIDYTKESLSGALTALSGFLEKRDLSPRLCYYVNLCCEELSLCIVNNNSGKGKGYTFDILVIDDKDDVKVTIKDAGSPFNPIRVYENIARQAAESDEETDLSLRIVNNICKELKYNYMYGQNTVYMSFAKS